VKKLLDKEGIAYTYVEIDQRDDAGAIQLALEGFTQQKTVPNVFVKGRHLGGFDDTFNANKDGKLQEMLAADTVVFTGFNAEKCDTPSVTDLSDNPFAYPVGIWTTPEAAYYGLTLAQAKKRGYANPKEAMALYRESLRGCVFSPEGLVKLVFDGDTGVVLGVHIVGEDACELIHFGMELVTNKRTISDVAGGVFSAVTFHELFQIAAKAALDPAAARKRRRDAGAQWAMLNKATRRLRGSDD